MSMTGNRESATLVSGTCSMLLGSYCSIGRTTVAPPPGLLSASGAGLAQPPLNADTAAASHSLRVHVIMRLSRIKDEFKIRLSRVAQTGPHQPGRVGGMRNADDVESRRSRAGQAGLRVFRDQRGANAQECG